MLITPDHISENTRAIIRSASEATFARCLRRENRTHRFMVILFFVSVATLVFALATRTTTAWWTVLAPMMIMIGFRRQVERDESEADLLKIALNPDVIAEIRRMTGSET